MSKQKITISLSESSIDEALKKLEEYKKEILRKTDILQQRIAKLLATETKIGFSGAIVDDVVKGTNKQAQVEVKIDNRGDITVVIAQGEDAVWVEFGAGVYHNGSAGTSPHPNGAELGFTIGNYGQGKGKQTSWGYYDETGKLIITRGTPAKMPMAKAVTTVCREFPRIAKEVFG